MKVNESYFVVKKDLYSTVILTLDNLESKIDSILDEYSNLVDSAKSKDDYNKVITLSDKVIFKLNGVEIRLKDIISYGKSSSYDGFLLGYGYNNNKQITFESLEINISNYFISTNKNKLTIIKDYSDLFKYIIKKLGNPDYICVLQISIDKLNKILNYGKAEISI